jgi:hypothetical protein
LPQKPARLGLARRVGQGRSNTADKARIILANIDLDPHKTPALHACAVRSKRGFCLRHSRASEFPEIVSEISRGRKGAMRSAAGTFEGEFSNVTRSYAGKGVVRYAW